MHGHYDWNGIATLIGAVGGFLTVLVTLAIQIINFRDQRRARLEQEAHKQILCNIQRTLTTKEQSNA